MLGDPQETYKSNQSKHKRPKLDDFYIPKPRWFGRQSHRKPYSTVLTVQLSSTIVLNYCEGIHHDWNLPLWGDTFRNVQIPYKVTLIVIISYSPFIFWCRPLRAVLMYLHFFFFNLARIELRVLMFFFTSWIISTHNPFQISAALCQKLKGIIIRSDANSLHCTGATHGFSWALNHGS